MRILCLHGYSTSGAILKYQLDAFIQRADASHEFVFLDGEYECPKAQGKSQDFQPSDESSYETEMTLDRTNQTLTIAGMGKFMQGPFRCFDKSFGPHAIQSSLDHLQDFIDEEGPFDGVIGFSQGGSLALAYLLREVAEISAQPGNAPVQLSSLMLSDTPPLSCHFKQTPNSCFYERTFLCKGPT